MKQLSLSRRVTLFAVFVAAAILPALASSPSASPAVTNGKHLFNQDCAACHDTAGASVKTGPVLKDLFHRQPRPADSAVRDLIQNGKGKMPAFRTLSTAQVNELLAYLKTL